MKKYNINYKVRFRISIILFSLIPCLISSALIFCIFSIPKISEVTNDKKYYFERSVTKINSSFDVIMNRCNSIATDLNIGKIFGTVVQDKVMYNNIKNTEIITSLLSPFKDESTGDFENFIIYHDNPSLYRTRFYLPISEMSHDIDIDALNRSEFVWERDGNLIHLYRKIETTANNVTAIIRCTIPDERVNKIIDDYSLNTDIYYICANQEFDTNQIRFLTYEQLRSGDIIALKPLTEYYQNIYLQAFGVTIVVLLAMIVLILYISLKVTRNLTGEIYTLIDYVKSETLTDTYNSGISENSELSPIYAKLKELVEKVTNLNDEKLQLEQSKYAVELQYVQSKINPHLLYNALSAIKWACVDENSKIARNIDYLVDYYRFTVSLNYIIQFKEEVDLVYKYMALLNATHSCEYKLDIDLPQEILSLPTIMHIFQPFVENSVLHGIRNMSDGRICITAKIENDVLYLKISDNGLGMLPERLAEVKLFNYDSKYQSFGIRNTVERLKLFYNKDCTIDISSEYKKGTDILISIPDYKNMNF